MHTPKQLSGAVWRTSSYSNAQGGECVEVAGGVPAAVPVRDSKDVGRGHIAVSPVSWASLTHALKSR